ncbi:MAG TPA: hypothetical protein VH835_18050 [Dongiaceae bacterium]|jgi:hypothetical protein
MQAIPAVVRYIPPRSARLDRAGKPNDASGTGRNLVCVDPPPAVTNRHDHARPSAPFLAQLIAARIGAPQARARRKAGPADASALYAATAAHPPVAGRIVRELR